VTDVVFAEHIWPVSLKPKGLSSNRGIPPGSYRLCLTNTDVSLIRLYSDKPDVVVPVSGKRPFVLCNLYCHVVSVNTLGPDLQNILRLTIMPKLRSTYYDLLRTSNLQNSYEECKVFLRYDSLAKL